jgi:DNA-binding response OmpR family regulator
MNPTITRVDDLTVVDAAVDDYAALHADRRLHNLVIRHFTTGEEALAHLDAASTKLWLANMRLPDMTGVAFLELVRMRDRRRPILLVSDEYSADDELAARAAGASAYLCKPVNAAWLAMCRYAASRAATRKGLPRTLG